MSPQIGGKYICACPAAIGDWINEHGGLPGDSSVSSWRHADGGRVTRTTLHRKLQELRRRNPSITATVEDLEELIRADTGPGRTWAVCSHIDDGMTYCPNSKRARDPDGGKGPEAGGRSADVTPGLDHARAEPDEQVSPAPDSVAARLELAYQHRADLEVAGMDTTEINSEILVLRREQRSGPMPNRDEIWNEGGLRLFEVIGQGGFAAVWRAYDNKRREWVAVKVLHGQFAKDSSQRERFFRGAMRMEKIRDTHVVRVLSLGREEQGFCYYVMEYCPRGDLHHAIIKRDIDTEAALDIVATIADVLEAVHAGGLVHRDVKPQNILLRKDGTPALADFDLVWADDTTGGTRTGAMGTVLYSAPEQNEDASKVDCRADIYSLGMTAIFCIFGSRLPPRAIYQRESFLAELPCEEALRATLRRAVAIAPEDRFQSMASFRADLAAARRSLADCELSRPIVVDTAESASVVAEELPRQEHGVESISMGCVGMEQLPLPFYCRWAAQLDSVTGVPALGAVLIPFLLAASYLIPFWVVHVRETGHVPGPAQLMLGATILTAQSLLFYATMTIRRLVPVIRDGAPRDTVLPFERFDSVAARYLADRGFVVAGSFFGVANVSICGALGIIGSGGESILKILTTSWGALLVGFICGMAVRGLYGIVSFLRISIREGFVVADVYHPDRHGGLGYLGSACAKFAVVTGVVGVLISTMLTMDMSSMPHGSAVWGLKMFWIAWPFLVAILTAFGPMSEISGLISDARRRADAELGRTLGELASQIHDATGVERAQLEAQWARIAQMRAGVLQVHVTPMRRSEMLPFIFLIVLQFIVSLVQLGFIWPSSVFGWFVSQLPG